MQERQRLALPSELPRSGTAQKGVPLAPLAKPNPRPKARLTPSERELPSPNTTNDDSVTYSNLSDDTMSVCAFKLDQPHRIQRTR